MLTTKDRVQLDTKEDGIGREMLFWRKWGPKINITDRSLLIQRNEQLEFSLIGEILLMGFEQTMLLIDKKDHGSSII